MVAENALKCKWYNLFFLGIHHGTSRVKCLAQGYKEAAKVIHVGLELSTPITRVQHLNWSAIMPSSKLSYFVLLHWGHPHPPLTPLAILKPPPPKKNLAASTLPIKWLHQAIIEIGNGSWWHHIHWTSTIIWLFTPILCRQSIEIKEHILGNVILWHDRHLVF